MWNSYLDVIRRHAPLAILVFDKLVLVRHQRLKAGIAQVVRPLGLADHFQVLGRDCKLFYATRDAEGNPSQAFRTLVL